ncbi:MAG: hypothetical protein EAZ60_22060 [Oscillatoriales cyanobacterium]|nr:MAG: hypothetical protein EAZ60_22060 [Oscillatoriales cyanobacterium]
MLTHHRKPVSLSLVSTDLPLWSVVETAGTLYQKDRDRFHLLLHEPASYRHCWERGMYGLSRYWLQGESLATPEQLRLRNFTRNLTLTGKPEPQHLRLEYELWSEKVQLGQYILNLEIHH